MSSTSRRHRKHSKNSISWRVERALETIHYCAVLYLGVAFCSILCLLTLYRRAATRILLVISVLLVVALEGTRRTGQKPSKQIIRIYSTFSPKSTPAMRNRAFDQKDKETHPRAVGCVRFGYRQDYHRASLFVACAVYISRPPYRDATYGTINRVTHLGTFPSRMSEACQHRNSWSIDR